MARPARTDVDYFPHEVDHGRKMHIIESKHGNNGYAVWFKLLELLGKASNHYINFNDDTSLMYLESKLGDEDVMIILKDLVKLNVIHPGLWEKKVIWIPKFVDGIADAYKRRSNKCWHLLDICKHLHIKCMQKPCYCGQCECDNPQRIGKDRKGKDRKEDIHPLLDFILENCPRICKIERQLTRKEAESLRATYHDLLIKRKLFAMENAKNLAKYNSVYLTLSDWCANDFVAQKNGEAKQLYKQPKWVEEQMQHEDGWMDFVSKHPEMAKRFITIGKEEEKVT